MKVNKWTLGLAAAGLVTLPSLGLAEEKLSPLMTAVSSTTISGYVDTSAHWDIGSGNANPAPFIYNQGKQDGFNLNRVKLRVESPLDDNVGWSAGYRADVWFGPDANVFGSSSLFSVSDLAIQQAYVALRAPVGNGLDFKMGVFDSIIGYESHDNVSNPNYTRSYATSWEPRSHTGLLATYQVFESVAVAAGVANTMGPVINSRAQDNDGTFGNDAEARKTYMGSIAFTVPDSFGFLGGSTVYAGAVDGFAGNTDNEQSNYYVGATLNTPATGLKVGASFDVADDISVGGVDVNDGLSYALYASFQATEKLSFHARGEYADAYPALFDNNWAATANYNVIAVTGTVQYDLWKNVLTRLEVRWDHASNARPFGGEDPGPRTAANPDGGHLKNAVMVAANVIYRF